MIKSAQIFITILWLTLFLCTFITINKLNHPISIMIVMIMYNIFICLNMSIWKLNYMYSILVFMIMISGLLIIFMYFSSLISNDSMLNKINYKILLISLINLLLPMTFMFSNKYFMNNQLYYSNSISDLLPVSLINMNKFFNVLNLYIYPFNNLTLLSMLFLLMAFIIIIKINSSSHSFPMRKISKYE